MSTAPEIEVVCLGPALEGVGKIHSELAPDDYERFGEALRQSIAPIEEPGCPACKDGRLCLSHTDGTPYAVRPRVGGGSGAAFAMMLLGDRNYVDGLEDTAVSDEDLYGEVNALMSFLKNEPGAHNECGALIGMKDQMAAIAHASLTMPNVQAAFQLADIQTGKEMSDIFAHIQRNAAAATRLLESRGWNGAAYTDTLRRENPHGVEELEVDHDHPVGGHMESAIAIIQSPTDSDLRPKYSIDDRKLLELTGGQAFTINQDEITRNATLLSSSESERQHNQLLAASWLHHVQGVAYKLTDGSQPVFILTVRG